MKDTDEMTDAAPSLDLITEIEEKIKSGEKWVKQGHYTKEDARWKQWEKSSKYLRCIFDDSWAEGKYSTFNVNTVFSNYNTKKPTLYFRNPKIRAVPTKPQFTRDMYGNVEIDQQTGYPKLIDNYNAAKIFSVKLNYELREIDFKNVVKKVIGDNLCPYGIGWVKWGYRDLTAGGHSNQRERSVSYWCKRVDPRNMIYDPMATSMDDCSWVAERLVLSRSECKELGFKIPKGYVCSLPEFLKDRAEKGTREVDTKNLVVLWEFHDLVENKIRWLLIADKNGGVTQEVRSSVEDPYPFEGSCYIPLVLVPDHDDIIGISDVEPIEDQALALNRMRTMEVKYMDNFGPTIIREQGATTANEMINFKRTQFGGEVVVNDGFINKMQIMTPPSIGSDHYNISGLHKEEIRTTLGITDYQQGGATSRTATEGNIIQNAANIRIEEQRDVVYDFIIACARRLAAMVQAFSDDSEYLNLKDEQIDEDYVSVLSKQYGYDPKVPFLRMNKQDIQGEYNFEFQIEDMVVRPKEIQIQQLNASLQAVGANPIFSQKFLEKYDVSKIINKIFELNGVDIDEFKKGDGVMISPETENMMLQQGMEVPAPNARDHDDEHNSSHGKLLLIEGSKLQQMMTDANKQQQGAQKQIQQLMQQMAPQQAPQQPGMPPQEQVQRNPQDMMAIQNQIQQMQQSLQQQIQQAELAMQPQQSIVRNIKLHMQLHDQQQQSKAAEKASGTLSGGAAPQQQQAAPQSAASMQTSMQAQAQQVH